MLSSLLSPLYGAAFKSVVIQNGEAAGVIERNVAALLVERIAELGDVPTRIANEGEVRLSPTTELVILLGLPENHTQIRAQFEAHRIAPLTALSPGPEGFLVKTVPRAGGYLVIVAGSDPRGVLYGAGEILRQMVVRGSMLELPATLTVRSAPAFAVRGTQLGQSSVALDRAKVRPWTEPDRRHAVLDFALAGLNTVEVGEGVREDDPMYRLLKSFGLKSLVHYGPNTGDGPPEWQAAESIGRSGYLCPSVPAAREALLKRCAARFRDSAPVDYVRFAGGDGGGCECDRCKPYGGTFIRLCEDLTRIIHQYHPHTEVFVTNQKFDNDDDQAIFAYLQAQPRTWLRAFCYGPGSDAMSWQPGHRQTHRMDLFRYPGFGPPARYPEEILHQLPPDQDLVFFNELTHWRYSQNGFIQAYPRADRNGDQPPRWNHFLYERQPDSALTMVYDRLTFFAWPRYFHWYFNQVMRYGIGDVTHSSGTHDHFNQWMWQRMLWSPQRSVEDLVAEYTRTWFGREAATLMAEAIFQLEDNLVEQPGRPIPEKVGIDRYYRLVRQAGAKMPSQWMKQNWLWREYMQKAALDKYVQLRVRQQTRLQTKIERAMAGSSSDAVIDQALAWLGGPVETSEMVKLRREAMRLGEESNRQFGVRSEGLFNLEHDFIGLGWLERQLQRARATQGAERAERLRLITHYADPGEGGFYDDCGTLDRCPNVVRGYPYDFGQPLVPGMRSEGNRPSQRTMHYTQDEDQGVRLHYRGLDPESAYRLRLTLVRPWYPDRYRSRMNQHTETIYAGDVVLARDLEVPERMSDLFTFDIPREAIHNGELEIRFERAPDVAHGVRLEREVWRNTGGWGTIVSEAWLMKRR
ncbi:MAG: hypothetical protein IT579_07275 [Verrucomicrobia subdivision 3 bacterium]|nr:hypothetical protein [Limisphaerales bacterium]